MSKPSAVDVAAFHADWSAVFGTEAADRMHWWSNYMMPLLGPHRGEPFLTLTAWVLAKMPAGWSGILDGYSFPNLDGLRGIIAHDVFPAAMPEFQFSAPGEYDIGKGDPVSRILPVPRDFLHPELRLVAFE